MSSKLKAKRYLGDGVYVGWDGFHVVLWLEERSAFGESHIALDPGTTKRLMDYYDYVNRLDYETAPEQV